MLSGAAPAAIQKGCIFMTITKTILSVWIGNLGDYNAGILSGQWFDLDDYDLEELETAVYELTNNGQNDYFIADSMSDYNIEIGEYDSMESLFEKYEAIRNIVDKYGESADDVIEAYSEMINSNLNGIESAEFYIYSDCYSMRDVAESYLDGTGEIDEIPEFLRDYFDYEKYGREMELNGTFYYAGGGVYVEILKY